MPFWLCTEYLTGCITEYTGETQGGQGKAAPHGGQAIQVVLMADSNQLCCGLMLSSCCVVSLGRSTTTGLGVSGWDGVQWGWGGTSGESVRALTNERTVQVSILMDESQY